jgi:hypothetical protein
MERHSYEPIRVPRARELAKPLLHSARSRLSALEREVVTYSGRSDESGTLQADEGVSG